MGACSRVAITHASQTGAELLRYAASLDASNAADERTSRTAKLVPGDVTIYGRAVTAMFNRRHFW